MKWLNLGIIKKQLRIDGNCEDDLLSMYGDSAEATVLNYCNTTYSDIVEKYGCVPIPLKQASLLLVDMSYQYRSPVSTQNLSAVPYSFDVLVKPYIVL